MGYLRRAVTWIASLASDGQPRNWISSFVNILGLLVLIGTLMWGLWNFIFLIAVYPGWKSGLGMLYIIGSILTLGIYIIAGIVLRMLFRKSTTKIRGLGTESQFKSFRTTAVLIWLLGASGFVFMTGIGAQTLFAGIFSLPLFWLLFIFHDVIPPVSLIEGLLFFLGFVLSGGFVLILTYLIAGLIDLFMDRQTNLKKIIEAKFSAKH
ncbi:MAG: hypothetical protein OXU36_18145 [Candidatus Poribacteria bacterium]|nr:hypothetical protein [Candidatus Poribacteria bacterium]